MPDPAPLTSVTLRPAQRTDAAEMVRLIDLAGDGLPMATWAGMAGPQADPFAYGLARAARDSGGFSWRNTVVATVDGRVAGCLISYVLPDRPRPTADLPPLVVPLQQLENLCPGRIYISGLAVYPDHRGRGIGQMLLSLLSHLPTCLIVGDANGAARALYARLGYVTTARRPAVHDGWACPHRDWLLLTRDPAPLASPRKTV